MQETQIEGGLLGIVFGVESAWDCCLAHPGFVLHARATQPHHWAIH